MKHFLFNAFLLFIILLLFSCDNGNGISKESSAEILQREMLDDLETELLTRTDSNTGTLSPTGLRGPIPYFKEKDVKFIISEAEKSIESNSFFGTYNDDSSPILVFQSAFESLVKLVEEDSGFPYLNVYGSVVYTMYSSLISHVSPERSIVVHSVEPHSVIDIGFFDETESIRVHPNIIAKDIMNSVLMSSSLALGEFNSDLYAEMDDMGHITPRVIPPVLIEEDTIEESSEEKEQISKGLVEAFISVSAEIENSDNSLDIVSSIIFNIAGKKLSIDDSASMAVYVDHLYTLLEASMNKLSELEAEDFYSFRFDEIAANLVVATLGLVNQSPESIREEVLQYLPKNMIIAYDTFLDIDPVNGDAFLDGLLDGYSKFYINYLKSESSELAHDNYQDALEECCETMMTEFIGNDGSSYPWPRATAFLSSLNSSLAGQSVIENFTIDVDTLLGPKSTDDFDGIYDEITILFN